MKTKDQAVDCLMHARKSFLAGWVYTGYEVLYDRYPETEFYSWSIPELVSWIISHYDFDEKHQGWKIKNF